MTDTSGTSDTEPTTTEDEAAVESPTDSSGSSRTLGRGRLAAIAGGAAAIGLVLGLLIGWFSFDNGGGSDRHNDRGRMSQQQGPGGGHQDGGQMKGGRMDGGSMNGGPMGPGMQGGQMMPGNGGQQIQPGQGNQVAPTAPSTTAPSTSGSAVPQSLQQG